MAGSTLRATRSEEHTSELQSRRDLVCRLLLEKKNKQFAHYVMKNKNKKSAVFGTPLVVLCGKKWVPSRDPKKFFVFSVFFFNDTATTEIYTLSLHDALPI